MKTTYVIPSIFLDHIELPEDISLVVNDRRAEMCSLGESRNLFDMNVYARKVKLSDILQKNNIEDLTKSFQHNASECSIYIEVDVLIGRKQSDLFFLKRGIQTYTILAKTFPLDTFFFLVEKSWYEYLVMLLHELPICVSSSTFSFTF